MKKILKSAAAVVGAAVLAMGMALAGPVSALAAEGDTVVLPLESQSAVDNSCEGGGSLTLGPEDGFAWYLTFSEATDFTSDAGATGSAPANQEIGAGEGTFRPVGTYVGTITVKALPRAGYEIPDGQNTITHTFTDGPCIVSPVASHSVVPNTCGADGTTIPGSLTLGPEDGFAWYLTFSEATDFTSDAGAEGSAPANQEFGAGEGTFRPVGDYFGTITVKALPFEGYEIAEGEDVTVHTFADPGPCPIEEETDEPEVVTPPTDVTHPTDVTPPTDITPAASDELAVTGSSEMMKGLLPWGAALLTALGGGIMFFRKRLSL